MWVLARQVNHRDTEDTEFSGGGGRRAPLFVRPTERPLITNH